MFTKELYKITCTRNGETSDIGTYLLKPGPETPMDCYRNFLNKTDVAVSIKSVPDGFIITDNSEPDTSYHLMFIPMDDDFWARCAAEKETKQYYLPLHPFWNEGAFLVQKLSYLR